MPSQGYAMYDPANNRLEILRPGENCTRYISCTNLNTNSDKVFGLHIDGDEIWVQVGPLQNQRPNREIGYRFSSLTGGHGRSL